MTMRSSVLSRSLLSMRAASSNLPLISTQAPRSRWKLSGKYCEREERVGESGEEERGVEESSGGG
jgi:hypothetical protein